MARVAVALVFGGLLATTLVSVRPVCAVVAGDVVHVNLWADRDDDDADGRPDGEEARIVGAAGVDLVPLDRRLAGATVRVVSGGEHARIVRTSDGRALPWGRAVPADCMFQGLTPGHVELASAFRGVSLRVLIDVSGIDWRDGEGRIVDPARSHASIERTPPMRVEGPADGPYDDFDALRVVLATPDPDPALDGPRVLSVESLSALGTPIDQIPKFTLAPSSCAQPYEDVRCWASQPLRLVTDDVDRNHPLAAGRSIKAEVGGAIVLRQGDHKAQMIRVLGPRRSPAGPIGRMRATLRPIVVRLNPGGAPSIGGTDAGAIEALRMELGAASAIWGQCGVTFGDTRSLDVRVVDPPPSHLVSIGDDLGVPASGGEIRLRADGRSISMMTKPGEVSGSVARELARAVEQAGLVAVVSSNARISPALGSSVDVSIRRKDGTLLAVGTVEGFPLSTDATLSVRVGSVDMSDGLRHFTDVDAMSGTLEERTLLKGIVDDDPTTIEVVVVPLFAGGGRIGESFIASDKSSLRNVVVLDRAGIRARKSSLTLAHELGHVLMDLPGHPDDYGVDTPDLLMDSDAADSSPFGPRRLTLEECARVVRQSGPRSPLPLLADWPIGKMAYDGARGRPAKACGLCAAATIH
ncbi:MAG: hypothetical protein ACREJ3_08985 [Polyangiaceae bacterium]